MENNTEIPVENLNIEQPRMELTAESLDHLEETRKWTLFMSIAGFVFIGFLILAFFIMAVASSFAPAGILTALMFIPMLMIMAVYFFPIYYLYLFSTNAKKAIHQKNITSMNTALKYLRWHYRFMGILMIVILSIYVLALLFGLAFGGLLTMMHL